MTNSKKIGIGTFINGIMIVGGILGVYYTTIAAVNQKIADVVSDVSTLKEAQSDSDKSIDDLTKQVNRIPYIEGKLDAALGRLGGNPQQVEATIFRQVKKENDLASTTGTQITP